MQLMVNGKVYSCSGCSYTSKNFTYVNKHYHAKHVEGTSQTSYPCPDCKRFFYDKWTMKRHHSAIHLGVKFNCDECSAEYKDNHARSHHIQTVHQGIRMRYNCEEVNCDRFFSKLGNLRAHKENVHNGTTYPCPRCEFVTNSSSYLVKHIRYKHEQLAYRCEYCDYFSDTKHKLRHHVDRFHNNIKD